MIPMPLGLWKSKWEIHREDMDRYREEVSIIVRSRQRRRRRSTAEQMARSQCVETRDLRADYERELSETRLFNRELLIRMEKTYASLVDARIMGESYGARSSAN